MRIRKVWDWFWDYGSKFIIPIAVFYWLGWEIGMALVSGLGFVSRVMGSNLIPMALGMVGFFAIAGTLVIWACREPTIFNFPFGMAAASVYLSIVIDVYTKEPMIYFVVGMAFVSFFFTVWLYKFLRSKGFLW